MLFRKKHPISKNEIAQVIIYNKSLPKYSVFLVFLWLIVHMYKKSSFIDKLHLADADSLNDIAALAHKLGNTCLLESNAGV